MELRSLSPRTSRKNQQTFSFSDETSGNEPLFSSTPGRISPSSVRSPLTGHKNESSLGVSASSGGRGRGPLPLLLPEGLEGRLAKLHTQIAARVRMKYKKQREAFWAMGGNRDGALYYENLLQSLQDMGIDLAMEDIEDLLRPFAENYHRQLILFPELARFLSADPLTVAHTPISSVEEPLPRPESRFSQTKTRHEELSAGYKKGTEIVRHVAEAQVAMDEAGASASASRSTPAAAIEPAELDDTLLSALVPFLPQIHESCLSADRSEDGSVSLMEFREAIRFVQPNFKFTDGVALAFLVNYPAISGVNGRVDYISILERIAAVRPEDVEVEPPVSLPKELFVHLSNSMARLREAEALFQDNPTWSLSMSELCSGLRKRGVKIEPGQLKVLLGRHVCSAEQANKPVHVGEFTRLVGSIPALVKEQGIPVTKRPRALHSIVVDKIQTHRQGAGSNYTGVFRSMDSSGTGLLSFADFRRGLAKWGTPLDEDEIEKLLGPFDRNNDGKLTYQEFTLMINQSIPEGEEDFDDKLKDVEARDLGAGVNENENVNVNADQAAADAVVDRVTAALCTVRMKRLADALDIMDRHGNGRVSRADARAAIESALVTARASPLSDAEADLIMRLLDPDHTGILLTSDIIGIFTPSTADPSAEREAYLEWVRREIRSRLDVRMGGSRQREVYRFFESAGQSVGAPRLGRGLSWEAIVAGCKRIDLDISTETAEGVMSPFMDGAASVSVAVLFKFLSQAK